LRVNSLHTSASPLSYSNQTVKKKLDSEVHSCGYCHAVSRNYQLITTALSNQSLTTTFFSRGCVMGKEESWRLVGHAGILKELQKLVLTQPLSLDPRFFCKKSLASLNL